MLNQVIATDQRAPGECSSGAPVQPAGCNRGIEVKTTNVILASGCALALEGLKSVLISGGFNVVGVGLRLLDDLIPVTCFTGSLLAVVDMGDGVEAASKDIILFRRAFPDAYIVALVDGHCDAIGLAMSTICINAIVDRNLTCETLLKTLNVVMAGYGVLSPVVVGLGPSTGTQEARETVGERQTLVSDSVAPTALSDREFEILGCIAEGQSNKVIARHFSISEATVKIHVRGILRKINARNRTQAAIWALHHGFGHSGTKLD